MIVYPNFQRTLFFAPGYSLFRCKGKKWIQEDEPAWWLSWWFAWQQHLKASFHLPLSIESSPLCGLHLLESKISWKIFKNIGYPHMWKIWTSEHKPERLRRTQAGMIIPVYNGPKQKECWRHERSFALTGLPCVGCAIPGVIPPSVVFSPLRG